MAINPFRSALDQNAIIQRVFDEPNDRLRVDASITAQVQAELTVEIDAASGDNIAIANADGSIKATITTIGPKNGLDVNILNDINATPTGLSKDIRPQRIVVGDTATKLPSSSLVDRNGISIRVLGTNTVFFGDNTVTTSNGYPKFQYEEILADIRDNASVDIYGICASGQTSEVAILEVA